MKLLNFRNTSTLFLLLFSVLFLYGIFNCTCTEAFNSFFCTWTWFWLAGLVSIYLGISVGMAFLPSSGFHYSDVYSHGDRNSKFLALTFDDGPDAGITPRILDILGKYNISAAFFVIGRNIDGNEDILKRCNEEGHVLGNHSWSHTLLWDFYPSGKMADDIERTIYEVRKVTGRTMKLFRPPYGVINPLVSKAIVKTGVKLVAWSFRSFDTKAEDPSALLDRILYRTRPGDVMLFHDNCTITAGILEKIIVSLQERGFSFISLEEMLKLKAYETS